jgi:hypothetical protein
MGCCVSGGGNSPIHDWCLSRPGDRCNPGWLFAMERADFYVVKERSWGFYASPLPEYQLVAIALKGIVKVLIVLVPRHDPGQILYMNGSTASVGARVTRRRRIVGRRVIQHQRADTFPGSGPVIPERRPVPAVGPEAHRPVIGRAHHGPAG